MSKLSDKPAPFKVTNLGTFAEINIIGEINWWSNSSADFTRQLAELRAAGVTELRGYINTPGGSLFDANEIYNQLAAFPGRKTAVLGALVASAGTTIACAFTDGIEMAANGQYMIHNPCVYVEGGEKELTAGIQMYRNVRTAAINIYVKRTAKAAEEIGAMMDATTWMTAQEARDNGFITGVLGEDAELPEDAAQVFNHYKIKNVPAALNQAVMALTAFTQPTNRSIMNKAAIIASMGLAPTATDSEVETAIASMKAAKDKAETDLAAEKLKVGKERAEILVDNAIANKKISAGQREGYITMAVMNYDVVKATLDAQPAVTMASSQVVPDPEQGTPSNAAGTGAATGDRANWTIKDYMEKAPEDLKMMAEKEPGKYRTLVSNAYPTVGKSA
jgi:ATP-dependent Clp protease protease subunit